MVEKYILENGRNQTKQKTVLPYLQNVKKEKEEKRKKGGKKDDLCRIFCRDKR